MSFGSLPSKKKELTELIKLTSHWCIVSSRFKSRWHFLVPEWAPFNSFRFMVYSGKRSVRIRFAHIGQMVSVPLFFMTSFFFIINFVSCFPQTIWCIHHTIPLVWLAVWDHSCSNRKYKNRLWYKW